ncbi:MAG: hypothetical protein QMD36_01225 [Candidatus Aenigmarchaeota archaeon]|nr:hypothetical protein [Candidatus Aenigmarchaeota archaeon]
MPGKTIIDKMMIEIFLGFVAIVFAIAGAALMKWKPKTSSERNPFKNAFEAIGEINKMDKTLYELSQPGAEKYLYNPNFLSKLYENIKRRLEKIAPNVDDLLSLKYKINQTLKRLEEDSVFYNKMSELFGRYFEKGPGKVGQALKHYLRSLSERRKAEKMA